MADVQLTRLRNAAFRLDAPEGKRVAILPLGGHLGACPRGAALAPEPGDTVTT